jgi:ABC-type uncharacterized transport system substrate-binding protein
VVVHGPIRLLGPGVLIAGEPPEEERFHVTAVYADKILKGASPADLPIWQPVSFEFGLNLGVAASLGLTLPPALIALADKVIE